MVKFLKKERISKDYSQNFAKKRNFRLLFNGLVAGRVLGFKLSGICSRGALSSALIQPFHFDYLAFFQSSFSQRGYKNTFCRHSVPPSFFTALMRPREILSVPFAQFHKKSFLFFNRFPIEKSTGFKNHLTEKRKQTESPILCPCCGQSPLFRKLGTKSLHPLTCFSVETSQILFNPVGTSSIKGLTFPLIVLF